MKITTAFLFVLACSTQLTAQKIGIESISESRSTGDSFFSNRTEIEFKITGDEVRKYKLARVGKIIKAEDDQGLDMMPEELDSRYEEIETNAKVKVFLRNGSRKASVIKELSGELVLFQPTEQNGAVLKIKDFEKKAGQNLTSTIKGLSVSYVTKDSYEKLKKEQDQKKEEELKKLPEATRKLAEGILSAFEGFFSSENDKQQAIFFINGDKNKLVDVYFTNAAGETLKNNGRMTSGDMVTYYLPEDIQSNWTMVLSVESEKATKIIPFKLTNIDLP